jgi:hypothetical protein
LTIVSNDPTGDKKITLWWHGQYKPTLHPVHVVSEFASADKPFEKILQVLYPGGEKALCPVLESVECGSPYIQVRPGENRPVAQDEEKTSGRVFGTLDLHLTVKPPRPGERVDSQCNLVIRQGQQVYKLGCLISVRFLGGRLTPDRSGLLFAAAAPDQLVGQDRTLHVTVANHAGDIGIAQLPDWLQCRQETSDPGARVLRFRIIKSPGPRSSAHTIHLCVPDDAASRTPIAIHCVTSQ